MVIQEQFLPTFSDVEVGLKTRNEIDLFTLSQIAEGSYRVKEMLNEQQGVLPFFVHPLYCFYNTSTVGFADQFAEEKFASREKIATYVKTFDRLKLGGLKSPKAQSRYKKTLGEYTEKFFRFLRLQYPIIGLAEESDKREQTIRIMREQGYTGTILYYNTVPRDPTPDFPNQLLRLKGYYNLVHIFGELGVQHLVVGGQILEVNRRKALYKDRVSMYFAEASRKKGLSRAYIQENIHSGCVAAFFDEMAHYMTSYVIQRGEKNASFESLTISPIVWSEDQGR